MHLIRLSVIHWHWPILSIICQFTLIMIFALFMLLTLLRLCLMFSHLSYWSFVSFFHLHSFGHFFSLYIKLPLNILTSSSVGMNVSSFGLDNYLDSLWASLYKLTSMRPSNCLFFWWLRLSTFNLSSFFSLSELLSLILDLEYCWLVRLGRDL